MKWTCPKCKRLFEHKGQQHSCASFPLADHFKNKPEAEVLFGILKQSIADKVGPVKVISLPCCIHLFGTYDFLAVLPKRRGVLEIRFGLDRALKNKRIFVSVPTSKTSYKNCLRIGSGKEIDAELLGWIRESYNVK